MYPSIVTVNQFIFAQAKHLASPLLDVGRQSITSDDDIYQHLARSYAGRISATKRYCNPITDTVDTMVRGADWYEVAGSMQDYGYLNYGTLELTMEVSCCKYPPENLLMDYWNYNRDAMIELVYQAQRGRVHRAARAFVSNMFVRSF